MVNQNHDNQFSGIPFDKLDDGQQSREERASTDRNDDLHRRIAHVEEILVELRELIVERRIVKESYNTGEIAKLLGRRPYTVREWCRMERVNAYKAMCGRGCEEEWRISHEELLRIQNEGLLPNPSNH